MKYKNNKFFLAFSLVALLTVGIFAFAAISNTDFLNDDNDAQVKHMQALYSIDVSDPAALAGDADYVFIGKVDKQVGTTYKHPIQKEDGKGGYKEVADPYTDYSVTVYENLKGELVLDQPIPVQKEGGISKDGKYYKLFENDELLKVGGLYIFYGYAQSVDGSILVSGENSTIALKGITSMEKVESLESAQKTPAYLTALNGVQNQKETDRKRAIATYDVRNQ